MRYFSYAVEFIGSRHTAADPHERQRVEAAGGKGAITDAASPDEAPRVLGLIEVTRNIGAAAPELQGLISHEPEINRVCTDRLVGATAMIVCSDGVWDFVTPEDVV